LRSLEKSNRYIEMRLSLYICLLLLSCNLLAAQQQQQQFEPIDDNTYLEAKKELGYDKTKRKLALRERFQAGEKKKKKKRLVSGVLMRLIAYILVGILFVSVLYMIFANVRIDKEVKLDEATLMEDIEDIEKIDADSEYKKAIANGNYRLAIRMLFIKSLQKLSAKDIIEWENEKTNRDYAREIEDWKLKQSFRKNASIYELVWYGDIDLDMQRFRAYDLEMNKFNNAIV